MNAPSPAALQSSTASTPQFEILRVNLWTASCSKCGKVEHCAWMCTTLENIGTTNNDTSQLLAPSEHRQGIKQIRQTTNYRLKLLKKIQKWLQVNLHFVWYARLSANYVRFTEIHYEMRYTNREETVSIDIII